MSNNEWCTPDSLFQVLDKGGVYQGIEFEGYHFDIDLCAAKKNSKCQHFYRDYLTNSYTYRENTNTSVPTTLECIAELNPQITCFMNPPYSRDLIGPMIAKAWEDSKHCKIVCLVKVDPSTKWWSTFWNYKEKLFCGVCGSSELLSPGASYGVCLKCDSSCERKVCRRVKPGPKPGCEVIFFPKRIKFDPPVNMEICKCTFEQTEIKGQNECNYCCKLMKHKLSGPSFASCLVIMDRRNV